MIFDGIILGYFSVLCMTSFVRGFFSFNHNVIV